MLGLRYNGVSGAGAAQRRVYSAPTLTIHWFHFLTSQSWNPKLVSIVAWKIVVYVLKLIGVQWVMTAWAIAENIPIRRNFRLIQNWSKIRIFVFLGPGKYRFWCLSGQISRNFEGRTTSPYSGSGIFCYCPGSWQHIEVQYVKYLIKPIPVVAAINSRLALRISLRRVAGNEIRNRQSISGIRVHIPLSEKKRTAVPIVSYVAITSVGGLA